MTQRVLVGATAVLALHTGAVSAHATWSIATGARDAADASAVLVALDRATGASGAAAAAAAAAAGDSGGGGGGAAAAAAPDVRVFRAEVDGYHDGVTAGVVASGVVATAYGYMAVRYAAIARATAAGRTVWTLAGGRPNTAAFEPALAALEPAARGVVRREAIAALTMGVGGVALRGAAVLLLARVMLAAAGIGARPAGGGPPVRPAPPAWFAAMDEGRRWAAVSQAA